MSIQREKDAARVESLGCSRCPQKIAESIRSQP